MKTIATGTTLLDMIAGVEHNPSMLKFMHALGTTTLNAAIYTAKALITARSFEAKQRLDIGITPDMDMRAELENAENPTIQEAYARLTEDEDYIRTLGRIERLQKSLEAAAGVYNMIYDELKALPRLTQYDRPNSINDQMDFLTDVTRTSQKDMEAAKLDALNTGYSLEAILASQEHRQVKDMLDLKIHRDEIRDMILAVPPLDDTSPMIPAVTQLKWAVKTVDRVIQRLARDGIRAMERNNQKLRMETALTKTFVQPACTDIAAWMDAFILEHKDEIREAEDNGFEIPELNIQQLELDSTKAAIKRLEEETARIKQALAA